MPMPSNKLLYILPDVTYFAELLPTKKEFTFAVQSFRQVNGEFIDDNDFLADNIEKLLSKFEKEHFTSLILPDHLFTNTIVNVKETDEKSVIAHLKEKLLPSLGLNTDTHYITTFVLTQFKGESRVQISALEKSVLAPLRVSASNHNITFDGVTALSWTAKSVISLEPSISVFQVGGNLYSSLHYIGIDQTTIASIDEVSNIAETIKTLKGGEPSIQTIYLLSNTLVEEKLTDELKSTLPVQQLASFKEDDSKMPSYIKQIIESGMKTLSIPDYLTPSFEFEKASEEDKKSIAAATESSEKNVVAAETSSSSKTDSKDETDTDSDDLPTPTIPASVEAGAALTSQAAQIKKLDLSADNESQSDADTTQSTIDTQEEKKPETTKAESTSENTADTEMPTEVSKEDTTMKPEKNDTKEIGATETTTTVEVTKEETAEPEPVDLRKFSATTTATSITNSTNDTEGTKTVTAHKKAVVIKNNSGVSSMLRMVFITLAVFFATVAVGVGVGLGLLKVTQQDTPETAAPVVVESPEPTAEEIAASESAQAAADFEPAEYSLLVVNATTRAGYAGTTRSDLLDAEFEDVDAANAKGEYDEGNYILVDEEIPGLEEAAEEATGLSFEVTLEDKSTEDTSDEYDAVVVLAE